MILISINKFADLTVKNNPGTNKAELVAALNDALARKNAGAVCMCCGNNIWQRVPLSPAVICVSPAPPAKQTALRTMK